MSYDFKKFNFGKEEIERIKNSSVDIEGIHSTKSGEVYSYPLSAKFRDYELIIKHPKKHHNPNKIPTYAEIKGSLHKSANGFNYDDFTINDAIDEVIRLVKTTNINPYNVKHTTIEFGSNIIIPWPPLELTSTMKFHSHNSDVWFTDMTTIGKNSIHSHWRIKAYSKRDQKRNNINENVFRFENHYSNAEKIIKVTGCKSMNLIDLFNPTYIEAFRNDLIQSWKDTYLIEPEVNTEHLTKAQIKIFERWQNPDYIQDILSSNKRKFRYEKRIMISIQSTYSISQYHKTVLDLLTAKLDEVLTIDPQKLSSLIDLADSFQNSELVKFDSSDKKSNMTINEVNRYSSEICPFTGYSIAMQNPESTYLNSSGINYYKTSDPKFFQALESRFITPQQMHLSDSRKVYIIAQGIRNLNRNRSEAKTGNSRILYRPDQLFLSFQ